MINQGVMAQPFWWDEQWTISMVHSLADVDKHLTAFEKLAPIHRTNAGRIEVTDRQLSKLQSGLALEGMCSGS